MKLLSCSFNLDTACVEILFDDGSSLMIDCTVIENQYGTTLRRRSELDWLIYNEPHTYVNLVLSGDIETYLKGKPQHKLED